MFIIFIFRLNFIYIYLLFMYFFCGKRSSYVWVDSELKDIYVIDNKLTWINQKEDNYEIDSTPLQASK